MKPEVYYWHPTSLQKKVEENTIEYDTLIEWIYFFNGMGFDVCVPKNFINDHLLYLTDRGWGQR